MGATIAQLAVEVSADTKDAQSGLSGILQTMLGFAGGQLIVNGVTDAFGFLKDQVGDVISATNEQDAATAQLNSTLKSTHDASGMTIDGLNKIAESMSSVTDYSKPMIDQSEKVLLTFTNIGSSVFPQATQASADLAARMGMDLASATLLVGKALNDPVKGMAALHREGVDLSAAQQEQVKHFMAVGDAADAQKIILGELEKEMGGAATANASTFGGQMQILKNKLDDLYATFGDDIEPALKSFVDAVGPIAQQVGSAVAQIFNLTGAFNAAKDPAKLAGDAAGLFKTGLNDLLGIIKQVAQGIETGTGPFGGLRDTLVAIAAFVFQQLLPALQQLGVFFTEQVLPAAEQLGNFIATTLLPAIGNIASFIITTVLPILKTFAEVFITDILPAMEKVATAIVDQLLPPLEKILGTVLPVLNPLLQLLGWILSNVIGPAAQLVINILGFLLTAISDLLTGIINFVEKGVTSWQQAFDKNRQTIQNFINLLGGFLGDIGTWVGNVLGAIGKLADGIINFFTGLPGKMISLGEQLINSFITGIQNMAGNLTSALKNMVGNAVSSVPGLGGVLSHIPGFATGGTMPTDGLAVVGEQGPELIQIPGGTQITPLTGSSVVQGPPNNMSIVQGAANGTSNGQPIQVVLYLDRQKLGMAMVQAAPQAVRQATGGRI